MSSPSYELAGPFSESAKEVALHVESFTVKLRAERNATHPLNPVGQLRRVVSGHHVVQDAILLLGLQFFEIFTVVHERSDTPQRRRGVQLKKRFVNAATSHLPKRLRREHEDEDLDELQMLPSGMSEADMSMHNILKDLVFSCGVAFAQVVRIRSSGKSITVFYHPNSMKAARLSRNYLTTAMRFTFCLETLEETTKLLKELERRMSRYTQAALFLGEEWVMPSALHIVAVTRPLPEGDCDEQQCGELLLQKDPPWGTTIPAPASWGAEATGSQTPLWVFLMTPLGYGKCEILPAVVSLYRKGKEASFYVGVRHPQVSGSALATVSQLSQIRPTDSASDTESLDGDDSDDTWQPADAEESFSSSSQGATLPGSLSHRSGSVSLQRSSVTSATGFRNAVSRSKAPSGHGVGGKHIRVHCVAKYVEPGAAAHKYRATSAAGGLLNLLPLHLPLDNRELLGFAVLLGILLWLSRSWMQLLLWLGLQLFLLRYLRPPATAIKGKPSALMGNASAVGSLSGQWQISVLRAEIVTDEPWSAAGESILAQVETEDGEESAEARKQRLADEYGFSEDCVQRFLLAFHGDEVVAHRRMHATYEWRLANDIQGILQQRQPHFRFFKGMFQHGLLGVTRGGHPIWFMKVGDMKPGFKVFKDSGLTSRHLARHIAFCMDYMYTVVESSPLPNGRALWVLDLKGMGLTDMGSDAFDMGKEIAGMISAHWPERLYRSFIINMPGFFSILWRLVEPMMAASTRKKIRLLRSKQDMLKELLEEMEEEDIPADYGGKLEGDVYSSREEQKLWRYVSKLGDQTS